jgi:hypothetical protein
LLDFLESFRQRLCPLPVASASEPTTREQMMSKPTNHRIRRRQDGRHKTKMNFLQFITDATRKVGGPTPTATGSRKVQKVLLIGGGGVGGDINRRIKKNLERAGIESCAEFLNIDTDDGTQSSKGEYPGFADHEFCHLPLARVNDVLRDPKRHKRLSDRLDLNDEQTRAQLQSIVEAGLDQAGQVRAIGLLAFWANINVIQRKLNHQLDKLRGIHAELKRQLDSVSHTRLGKRLQVIILGSLCGGTNGGIAVEIAALVRHVLKDLDVDITGIFVMPNALDGKLAGKTEEKIRVRANFYDAIRTLDAFNDGFGDLHNFSFGANDREAFKSPPLLFNQIFLAGRILANGQDLGSLEAVEDMVALHVVADIGSSIGERFDVCDANDVVRQNLATDPVTGRFRRFSTLSATALGFDATQLLLYCVARQLEDLCHYVKSPGDDVGNGRDAVLQFLRENKLADSAMPFCMDVRAALPNPDTYANQLYRRPTPREYVRNCLLADRLQATRVQFREVVTPKLAKQIEELAQAAATQVDQNFKTLFKNQLQEHGNRGALRILKILRGELDQLEQSLTEEENRLVTAAIEFDKRARTDADELKSPFRAWFYPYSFQDRIVLQFRQCIAASLDSDAKRAALALVQQLRARGERLEVRVLRANEELQQLHDDATRLKVANSPAGQITTSSAVEVDMASPEMFQSIYSAHRCDDAKLLARAASNSKLPMTQARLEVGNQLFEHVIGVVVQHFAGVISKITVADQLAHQLEAGSKLAAVARLKLQDVVKNNSPMWQADPRLLDLVFTDSIILGVPSTSTAKTRSSLESQLKEISAGINDHPRYLAEANIDVIDDPHRLIAVRRSHGGRPHYLHDWDEIRECYVEWVKQGNHTIHTFPRDLIALMPSLEPVQDAAEGEEEFALALSLGFIARRGPFYFWNLQTVGENGSTRHVVRLASEWDGLAFAAGESQPSGSLEGLVSKGRLVFENDTNADASDPLADELEKTRRVFLKDQRKIDEVRHAFKLVRSQVGDQTLLPDLIAYTAKLPQRVKPGEPQRDLVMKQVFALQKLIARLQNAL